jgi:hypothetical protein
LLKGAPISGLLPPIFALPLPSKGQPMPFKPNYNTRRADRRRAQQQKQEEKQQRREEKAAQRKAARAETLPADDEPASS